MGMKEKEKRKRMKGRKKGIYLIENHFYKICSVERNNTELAVVSPSLNNKHLNIIPPPRDLSLTDAGITLTTMHSSMSFPKPESSSGWVSSVLRESLLLLLLLL